MTPIDFTKWLQGFLDAQVTKTENEELIQDKLNEVDSTEPSPQFPFGVVDIGKPDDDNMVPYHQVCGCEVCGCTMANRMVDKRFHSQTNFTSTRDIDLGDELSNEDNDDLFHD